METRDIIILSAVALVVIFRLYSRYNKKKSSASGYVSDNRTEEPIRDEANDYEPYSSDSDD